MATAKQIKLIHTCKGALHLSDEDYRAILAGYGVQSSKDLSTFKAAKLLADLEEKAAAAGVWKRRGGKGHRPHNMATGRSSRAAQLEKIGALLTVGGKSWAYADGMAKRICKVEKVAWVADDELYKVIAALRYQAKREGWDLSGEGAR
ncbi:MAG: regulatory protein GemA [Desulfuromonadales bacterium]|nr:regulatory protein GemA [Desulfuromonadales bacterium]